MPSPLSLESELHIWQQKWKNVESPPETLQESLKMCPMHLYLNIHTVLTVSGVFPVTSCECERSLSTLGSMKTKLRATMGQDRLSSMCLLSIHRDVKMDIEGHHGAR
ncbi:P52K-like protein [Mya arenaria]|uniref:P52K-like protein n=1 Tax=Mya arenaria TaxID=6604 RepID=A0ABY7EI08_MYAAR|nr:P52K-like protein [Mya arenaria]